MFDYKGLTLGLSLHLREEGRLLTVVWLGWLGQFDMRELFRYLDREIMIDKSEASDSVLVHNFIGTFRQLKLSGQDDVFLLGFRHRVVEQGSLRDVLLEFGAIDSFRNLSEGLGVRLESALLRRRRRYGVKAVGVVPCSVLLAPLGTLTILLIGHKGAYRSVDRDITKVDTQTRYLGVLVGEVSASQQRVRGEVHSGHNVLCAESHLFDLGKVVDGVGIQREGTNVLHGHQIFRNDLNVSVHLVALSERARLLRLTFVESKRSKSNLCSSSSLTICTPSSHLG